MRFIKKNEMFLLEEIIKKNFSAKYKDSYLGILWTILSPLLLMALFTIIFSTLFKRNIENFPLYFLSGWCLFMFFNGSIAGSMDSLRGNKHILQRTPVPKYIFVLGAIFSEILNLLIMMILLIGIMIITNAAFYGPIIFFAIIPVFSLLIMLIGFGLLVSIVCVYYTDIRHLWTIVSMMIMYSSAIFYPMEIIPEPYYSILILNPFYWAVDQFRCFIYYGVVPQLGYMLNLILFSLIILILGVIVFKKYENRITMKF